MTPKNTGPNSKKVKKQRVWTDLEIKLELSRLIQRPGGVQVSTAAKKFHCHSTRILRIANQIDWPIKLDEDHLMVDTARHSGGGQLKLGTKIFRPSLRIAVISNPHLGQKNQQLGLIKDFIRDFGSELDMVIVAGGLIAGQPKVGEENHYFLTTFDEQIDYFVQNWPKLPKGKKYYILNGPSDLRSWQTVVENPDNGMTSVRREPKDVAYALCDQRSDFVSLGSYNNEITITGTNNSILLWHTRREDKSIYTIGYPHQNIRNSLRQANRARKGSQAIIVCGYHVVYASPEHTEVQTFAVPSMISPIKSLDLEKRSISPTIGITIFDVPATADQPFKLVPKFIRLDPYVTTNDWQAWPDTSKLKPDPLKVVQALEQKGELRAGEIARVILQRETPYAKTILKKLLDDDILEYDSLSRLYRLATIIRTSWIPVVEFPKLIVKTDTDLYAADLHAAALTEYGHMIWDMLKIARAKGIKRFGMAGDLFEGTRHFKGHAQEIYLPAGMGMQRELVIYLFKQAKEQGLLDGIEWIGMISGQHDQDATKSDGSGHDDVAMLVAELNAQVKNIFEYLGQNYGSYELNGIKVKMVHPSGGLPKGDTYRIQGFIEDLNSPTDVLSLGHLHVPTFVIYQGVVGVQCGAFKGQDNYLAAKGKYPGLGFWTVTYGRDNQGNIVTVSPIFWRLKPARSKTITLTADDRSVHLQKVEYHL